MTIRTIQLKNFQSHKDTRLDLAPGVNVVVGRSDSGKTAILRALEWVRTNRPVGDAFRSHWGGGTHIAVELDDGAIISRTKKDKLNIYGADNVDFKAIGQGVPEDIIKLLGLTDINIQHQHDPPFLLTLSPGQVARELNRFADLDRIDDLLSTLSSRLLEARRTADHYGYEAERMKEEAEPLDKVLPQLDVLFATASSLTAKMDKGLARITALEGILEEAEGMPSARELRAREGVVAKVEGMIIGIRQTSAQYTRELSQSKELTRLLTRLEDLDEDIQEHKSNIKSLEAKCPAVCPTCGRPWRRRTT